MEPREPRPHSLLPRGPIGRRGLRAAGKLRPLVQHSGRRAETKPTTKRGGEWVRGAAEALTAPEGRRRKEPDSGQIPSQKNPTDLWMPSLRPPSPLGHTYPERHH
ncbi:hypothetical protein NDU88_003467 [Pleurodeles waltl]|uniref:Uncharacterized protein n=1 Tax=Pleurodeles waltl TaxID=8319 RepID=A0AAV7TP72_PLEWA|nr:hypothetical protein NDU88_003467 [Pleurodeles waltl]